MGKALFSARVFQIISGKKVPGSILAAAHQEDDDDVDIDVDEDNEHKEDDDEGWGWRIRMIKDKDDKRIIMIKVDNNKR